MNQFNSSRVEVFGYPILLLLVMWTIYIADNQLGLELYRFGVHPRYADGLSGIAFMPLIHSQRDFNHILNNSIPIFVLLASLIYFYRELAVKVFVLIWLFTGLFTWVAARESYHIGMSGVIYGLVGFLFFSGAIRKYRPLMGLSLVIVFLYGSLVWGIFPMEEHISWEGHLFGFGTGVILAFAFRAKGPQSPKYRYEIEKELGIEPEDLEEKWRQLNQISTSEVGKEMYVNSATHPKEKVKINYDFIPRETKVDNQSPEGK